MEFPENPYQLLIMDSVGNLIRFGAYGYEKFGMMYILTDWTLNDLFPKEEDRKGRPTLEDIMMYGYAIHRGKITITTI